MLVKIVVAAVMMVMAARGGCAQGAGGHLSLTIGGAPIVPYANSIVAVGKGFFAEAGLTVERKAINTADVAQSALVSGDIDVAAMAIDTLSRGHLAGFDWRMLYQADLYDPKLPDAYIVARSDLVLGSPKDLEGKNVAVVLGSIGEPGVKAWLRDHGADPAKIHLVGMALPQMLAALQGKTIDAAHMVNPGLTLAIETGAGKIVGPDLDAIGGRFVVSGYVAKASWIAANSEKARRFTQAIAAATKFIIEHPAEALAIVAKDARLDEALAAKFFPERYGAALDVTPDEIQHPIDFLARESFIQRGFNYAEIVSEYMPVRR